MMIKKTLIVLMVALAIISCNKKDETLQLQEVSFKAMEVTPNNGLKADGWDTLCVDVVPNYAHVVIANTGTYDPQLFELDGVLYTQALKLPVIEGNYCVEEFFLYSDEDDSGDYSDGDVIVFATPETGSHFGAYVTKGIEYCFPVSAFTKAELDIEVLCFKPAVYDDFGFDWFQVTEIVVRQFCFFGDICITNENAALFANSVYAADGLNPDEEAQFRVIVKDNGVEVPYSPFSNEAIYGTGEALCVDYPDNLTEVNNFTFELQVWVPSTVPGVFVWQTYATFTSTDAGNLFYLQEDLGDNTTVKSFAIGTCSPMSNPIFAWLAPLEPVCDPDQGFEENTIGWLDMNNGWYGIIARVASGTNGITAADGSWYANFAHGPEGIDYAPFTRYCGYNGTWPGEWYSTLDVYVDVNWASGKGFEFSTATNNSSGTHLRDFIWHIGQEVSGTGLLVNASNNTDFTINSWKLLNENGGNYYQITSSGWYTFKTVFKDVSGALSVNFELYDSDGNLLHTITRSNAGDLIPSVVGGHRYGWFTVIDVDGGIAVDNSNLVEP